MVDIERRIIEVNHEYSDFGRETIEIKVVIRSMHQRKASHFF